MAERGLRVDHSTIRRWMLRYAPLHDRIRRTPVQPIGPGGSIMHKSALPANGPIYIGQSIPPVRAVDFMPSPKRDAVAATHLLRLTLRLVGRIGPKVINVDEYAAYPQAIRDLKTSGGLGRRRQCRPAPYVNNVLERDHRFLNRRKVASPWF